MPKRSPIDYTPQSGGAMFRPRAVVEDELAAVVENQHDEPTPIVATQQSRPTEKSSERSNERTNTRTNERLIVRHSFDIGRDQLMALAEIQTQIFNQTGRKPKLGPLVQDALDAYITKHRKRTNERSNERSNERTNE
jgi:hypothetical protein